MRRYKFEVGVARKKTCLLGLLLSLVLLLLSGCRPFGENKEPLATKTLEQLYPGDLAEVDAVEIRSGSTGQLVKVTDSVAVRTWLNEVRNMDFIPDPNQEDRTGYLYAVMLYEGEEQELSFTNISTEEYYYIHNDAMMKRVEKLFKEYGGK